MHILGWTEKNERFHEEFNKYNHKVTLLPLEGIYFCNECDILRCTGRQSG